jgi:TonB-linked SusC/RagA family outer membrane protein
LRDGHAPQLMSVGSRSSRFRAQRPGGSSPFTEVMVIRLSRSLAGAAILGALAAPVAAQTGSITGQVLDRGTRAPLVGVQVYLEGTSIGGITQDNGRFLIQNVVPGTYTVVAQYLGYANGRSENVRVEGSETAVVDFELATQALTLEEVVVTGTVDPVAGVKVPFSVGKVTKDKLPVPVTSAATAIQGKVAGARVVRGSGQPGSGASILLRGVHSLERNNTPLIVVDGVILGETMSDIDSSDIQSIEIVKGAAAASLYGSRASSGVIQITTNRGRDVAQNDTRITVRTEVGQNQLNVRNRHITAHHHYLVQPGVGYVDEDGNPVSKDARVTEDDLIADNPYPGPLYDHLELFFDPGTYVRNSVSVAQNTTSTNFMASFNISDDGGVVPGLDGAQLYGARVNLDHRLRSDLNVSLSSYYSRFESDNPPGGIFYDLMFMPPDVDLTTVNENDQPYIIQPDPFTLQENPLYNIAFVEDVSKRSRFTGSAVARYSPANWFSVEGNFSLDRSDRQYNEFTPKGTLTLTSTSNGSIDRDSEVTQAINGGVTGSLLHSFGDLTVRTKAQYLIENETNDEREAGGSTLAVGGVPAVGVAVAQSAGSEFEEITSIGYYLITGLDYAGKYIAEGLVRRDGSSLFGPENRWQTYFRASGAWRLSQEPWWFSDALNEFKLRYSIGTAGGRPNFGDRFEVWDVSGSGNVSKDVQGNRDLKPELQTEQEFGIDMILNNRYSLQLTHARSKVEDQLLQIPLPALFGYGTQWQNAGTIESNTWEATIEAALLQTPNTTWSIGFVADRTRSEITEFDRGCYRTANGTQYYCAGVQLGTMWGKRFMTSPADAPGPTTGAWDVNDDGMLVPVGQGNTFRDGMAKDLWGTRVEIDGAEYAWGLPVIIDDSTGGDALLEIGDGNPDFNVGLSSNFTWKGFNLYALFDAKIGGDVYNNTRQWGYRDNTHGDYDQSDKPDELKKPVTYYQQLYNTNSTTSWFVDDGTFVKFRELALQYTFRRELIERLVGNLGVERVAIGVIGRNLHTFTDYFGFDPEVGSVTNPYDGFGYPNYRNFTIKFDVEF